MIENEVGLITIGFMGIQIRVLLWGTEFTLIFAYLAALYFFLRHTLIGFRVFTFTIFAKTISFMWIGFAGTDIGSERYFQARTYAIDQGILPPHWSNAAAPYISKLPATASFLGHARHALAIIGAFYIAFFYHWRART